MKHRPGVRPGNFEHTTENAEDRSSGIRSVVHALVILLAVTLGIRLVTASAPVLIAIASSAPANSLWDKVLQEMGQDWQTASGGNVRLRMLRAQGDESTIIKKMQISNQLQAATLTGIGLSEIDPAFNVFGIPLFYDSYDEFFAVQDALSPMLKARLDAKGLVLVHWGHAGWVQVFSKKPVQKRLRSEVPGQDAGAITEMTKKGLKVIKVDLSSPKSEWRVEAEKFASSMRGGLVPADIFDAAIKERDSYRKQHPPRGGR